GSTASALRTYGAVNAAARASEAMVRRAMGMTHSASGDGRACSTACSATPRRLANGLISPDPPLHELSECAADPVRKREHQRKDADADYRSPVFGRAGERVLQPRERGRAEQRPEQCIEAAQQHDDERIDGPGNRERFGRNAALGEREQAAG